MDSIGAAVYNMPHHVTPPRLRRGVTRLTSYSAFVGRRSKDEVYLSDEIKRNIAPGTISVIDVYRVPSIIQPFVIGDVMRKIDSLYKEKSLKDLPNLLIFIDELNTFAPAHETPSAITQQIVEIALKGRGRKTGLFGVSTIQKRS